MAKLFPIVVTIIDFDTILPIWTNLLWPGRTSTIDPISTMTFLGGYDMSIRTKYADQVSFFGMYDILGDLVGVFSGHPTSDTEYRARGLYVRQDVGRRGIGRALVETVVNAASNAGRDICWCLPRIDNVNFFERCGFVTMSAPFSEGVEFGPNVYMARPILPQ